MSVVGSRKPLAARPRTPPLRPWRPTEALAALRGRSLAWAGYAASAWAIAYAVGVRGDQGLGGTIGIAGTFQTRPRCGARASSRAIVVARSL